jgi:hypothetical protein
MSFPIEEQLRITPGLLYLANNCTVGGVIAAASLLESSFYASLIGWSDNACSMINKIRQFAIIRFNEIQIMFTAVNFASVGYLSCRLFDELQRKNMIKSLTGINSYLGSALIALTVIRCAYFFESKRNKAEVSTENENNDRPLTITQINSTNTLLASKIILSSVLSFMPVQSRPARAIFLTSTYSAIKASKLIWKVFSRELPGIGGLSKFLLNFHIFLPPAGAKNSQSECPICCNDTSKKVSFCFRHFICTDCVTKHVISKHDTLIRNITHHRVETIDMVNGVYNHTSWHYVFKIPSENLPSCPECREVPRQVWCSGSAQDARNRKVPAIFNITTKPLDQPSLFDIFKTAYSVFQASLTCFQQYPELTSKIYSFQKICIGLDILLFGATCSNLFQTVALKKKLSERSKKDRGLFILACAVSIAACVALSYFAAGRLNAFLTPAVDLQQELLKSDISANTPPNFTAHFVNPLIQRTLQSLTMSRAIVTLALSFFSTKRKLSILSAIANAVTLFGLSSLRFISVAFTVNYPLGKVIESGGTVINASVKSLREITINATYNVPSSCAKSIQHLQSLLQSVNQEMHMLLEKSIWRRQWFVLYQRNLTEISRKLTYDVLLPRLKLFNECGNRFLSNMTHINITGFDNDYKCHPEICIS